MDSHSVLDALSKERNISLEEMYISYPRSATILAAACAVIFSVVGVTGQPPFFILTLRAHQPQSTCLVSKVVDHMVREPLRVHIYSTNICSYDWKTVLKITRASPVFLRTLIRTGIQFPGRVLAPLGN
uniref:(California timema) hypothetical protein n=1 Tax=Timema californicum TaxID=61474 RepID=A0A7R9JFQ4_TIMCA|nr:unnamed protein product [Timema californicum]